MLEKLLEIDKTCRACTRASTGLSSLFDLQDAIDGVCFSDMIKECTVCTVQEDDELPKLICLECKDMVRIAYAFKKQCEESHRKLLTIIQSIKEDIVTVAANSPAIGNEENNEQVVSKDSNNLRKKSTRNATLKIHFCDKCELTFVNHDLLKEHVKADHSAARHTCSTCLKEFIRMGHLTRHINKCHKKVDVLEQNTKLEETVKTEAKIVNKSEAEVKHDPVSGGESASEVLNYDFGTDDEYDAGALDDCESVKSEKAELETSEDKDSKELPTNIDTKETEDNKPDELVLNEMGNLPKTNVHKKHNADSNRRFQCDQCHKAFKRKSHLKQHSLIHTKLKPYQCTICQKRFGRADNLKVHMSNHGQKHFPCPSCDRSFAQAYLLKRHKEQTHSQDKAFLCSECGQRFARNGDLAVHMRRHTGEKPYKCQYCNKGFTRSTEVYVHERYHTGEKRHVCSTCGKAFQRPYNLLVHVRTHTGERPYQCPHCPKNFAQCSDLKAHIRRHTGERYKCDQCGMGFIHVFVLNQHKLSVHGIEVQSRIKRVEKLSTDTQ